MFSLHPVTFYGQNCENQKCVEVVASLFKLQDMLTKIYFLVLAFESWNGKESRKNDKRSNQ